MKNTESILDDLDFSEEYINGVGMYIMSLAEKFYEELNLENVVYFNDSIFEKCLVDILVDLNRLKCFHDIDKPNACKLIAYTASWCVRRKPFQLIDCEEAEENVFINEKFALSLLLQAAGLQAENNKYFADKENDLKKDLDYFFYHLKYRNTNPQTLELLLNGIDVGKMVVNQ